MPPDTLYDTDFYQWTQAQAALLRERVRDLDWDNLAEEIESVGRSDKRTITTQLIRLLAHLLKWQYEPSHRGHSWQDSITDARRMIALTIEDSPSLHLHPDTRLVFAYRHARHEAHRETGLPLDTFPDTCLWDVNQVLDDDFWPEG
jgi:hypothetical protein